MTEWTSGVACSLLALVLAARVGMVVPLSREAVNRARVFLPRSSRSSAATAAAAAPGTTPNDPLESWLAAAPCADEPPLPRVCLAVGNAMRASTVDAFPRCVLRSVEVALASSCVVLSS